MKGEMSLKIDFYKNSLTTENGQLELYVADNICNTFVYPEFLLKNYTRLSGIDDTEIQSVLDVGCGAGPFCIFWGLLGKKVVGIDINPIAVECSRKNVIKYLLQDKVSIVQAGIESFSCEEKFDMIVCNPAIGDDSYMRKNLSSEYAKMNSKISNNIIDAEVEDFLTNCWKDANGKDMMDHIFEKAGELLRPYGKILIICGDDSVDGASFICSKITAYPTLSVYKKEKYIEHLRLEDSGEVYECDKSYNILCFEYIDR